MSSGPVETKVTAAGTAAAVAAAVVWALQEYVFHGDVPEAITALLYIFAPGVCAFIAGFATKHTWRTDVDALATRPPLPGNPTIG